jgi:hypothetical protein
MGFGLINLHIYTALRLSNASKDGILLVKLLKPI